MGHIYIYIRNGNNPIPLVLNTRQEPWFRMKKELIFGTMQQVCAIFREGSIDLSLSRSLSLSLSLSFFVRMYGLFQTTFYFGYMALFSIGLGLMCGKFPECISLQCMVKKVLPSHCSHFNYLDCGENK